MNNILEALKEIFMESSDFVFIFNHNFEILWQNKENCPVKIDKESLSELFGNNSAKLQSGDYTIVSNDLEYPIKLINYKNDGLHVIQLSGKDVFASAFSHRSVKHFLANQEAQIRDSVIGINITVDLLKNLFDENNMSENNYLADIVTGNCYKLLRSVVGSNELMKYDEDMLSPVAIELVSMLRDFTETCEKVVRGKIKFTFNTSLSDVLVRADTERFKTCLLELMLLTCRNNKTTSEVTISLSKLSDSISLTFFSDGSDEEAVRSMFSKLEKLYNNESSDPDFVIVERFCSCFNGKIYAADMPRGRKTYSLRLPEYISDGVLPLRSSMVSLGEDRFSIYNIMLSELNEYE